MYTIVVDYAWCRIDPQLPAEMAVELSNKLSYYVDGYKYTRAFKLKKWNGKNTLFNLVDQRFRTGLIQRVSNILEKLKVEYKIVDIRKTKQQIDRYKLQLGSINPHQFQLDAVQSTIPYSHGIIASPTGSGKSLIIALLIQHYNARALVIENSRVLLDQMYESLDECLPSRVGIVGDGDFELNDVVVATYQSLSSILGLGKNKTPGNNCDRLLDWLKEVDLILIDETHEADTDSITGICERVTANKIIGVTATPYAWAFASQKGANLPLEQNCGIKIYDSRDLVDFIAIGLMVPLCINRPIMPTISSLEGLAFDQYNPDKASDYKSIVDTQIIGNDERIKVLADHTRKMVHDQQSTYVYYSRIAYGERLCQELSDLDPIMLQGSTPRDERRRTFKNLESKKQLLVVSDIGSYGMNIRSLNTIIMASAVKDSRQLKGRVARAFPGKQFGVVIDPVDQVPILHRHSEMRKHQYEKDHDFVIG